MDTKQNTFTAKIIDQCEKRKSFLQAVEPLIKWMNENCHPHHECIVNTCGAELLESQMCVNTEKYLKD